MRILSGLLAVLCLAAEAAPNPAVSRQWVADEAKMLAEGEQSRLWRLAERIHWRTGAQVVVLTTPEVAGMGTRDYATKRFREWGLGSAAKNDGVLVLVSLRERAVEIVVGSGLTKTLPGPALAEMIRDRMTPALRDGQAGEALANGMKGIGARLAGIDEKAEAPAALLGAVGCLGLALGGGAMVLLWRFRNRSQPLPTEGLARAESGFEGDSWRLDRFRDDKPAKFFVQQSGRPAGGYESYPANLLWGAVLGLALGAAGLAGAAVAAMHPELEPSFWMLYAVLAVACPITFLALAPLNDGSYDVAVAILAGIFAAVGGAAPAYFGAFYLLSDFALAAYLAAGWALVFNLGMGRFLIRRFYGWVPEKFACERCGAGVKPLTDAETQAGLPGWGSKAIGDGRALFRGWRCAGSCAGVYLAYAAKTKSSVCGICNTPTRVEFRERGIRVWTCVVCGAAEREALPAARKTSGSGGGYTESTSSLAAETPTYSSSSTDDYNQRDQWQSYDNTPSSGGTTDGDGASGTW